MAYYHDPNYTPEEQKIIDELKNKPQPMYEVLDRWGEWRRYKDETYLMEYAKIKMNYTPSGQPLPKNEPITMMLIGTGEHDSDCKRKEYEPLLTMLSGCLCGGEKLDGHISHRIKPFKKGRYSETKPESYFETLAFEFDKTINKRKL